MGPESLHVQPAPQRCGCCRLRDHALSSEASRKTSSIDVPLPVAKASGENSGWRSCHTRLRLAPRARGGGGGVPSQSSLRGEQFRDWGRRRGLRNQAAAPSWSPGLQREEVLVPRQSGSKAQGLDPLVSEPAQCEAGLGQCAVRSRPSSHQPSGSSADPAATSSDVPSGSWRGRRLARVGEHPWPLPLLIWGCLALNQP